jgi:hypothetical protein
MASPKQQQSTARFPSSFRLINNKQQSSSHNHTTTINPDTAKKIVTQRPQKHINEKDSSVPQISVRARHKHKHHDQTKMTPNFEIKIIKPGTTRVPVYTGSIPQRRTGPRHARWISIASVVALASSQMRIHVRCGACRLWRTHCLSLERCSTK